jgi:hypothetical protein
MMPFLLDRRRDLLTGAGQLIKPVRPSERPGVKASSALISEEVPMSRKGRWAVVLGVLLLADAMATFAQDADKPAQPKVVSSDPAELAAIKAQLAKDAGVLQPALDRVIANADKALEQRCLSVLDRKKSVDGADAHDYVSFAPYFWPDPNKPDGLPYVRPDGRHNNELVRQGDRVNFGAVTQAGYALALGY